MAFVGIGAVEFGQPTDHLSDAISNVDPLSDEMDVAQRHTEQAYLMRFADKERKLLHFVQLVTNTAYKVTAETTQHLRDVGWADPEIAEAVYITALFAFFNRVADAFGLEDPGYQFPPPEK